MTDDTSTFIANSRLGSSLRLDDNNESVVSGMTDASWGEKTTTSSSSLSSSRRAASASSSPDVSSLPPGRFRGGTASRLVGGAAGDGGNRRGHGSGGGGRGRRFDTIAEDEAEEGEEAASSGGSSGVFDINGGVGNGGGILQGAGDDGPRVVPPPTPPSRRDDRPPEPSRRHRTNNNVREGPSNDDPASRSSSSYSSSSSSFGGGGGGGGGRRISEDNDDGGGMAGITGAERMSILLAAYDDARLPTHNPKSYATREVDVSNYQDVINDADEVTSLPGEYVLDEYGYRYHPSAMDEMREMLLSEDASRKNDGFELLLAAVQPSHPRSSYSSSYSSLLSFDGKRWRSSLTTILAAVTLAVAGICLSVRSLSSFDPSDLERRGASSSSSSFSSPRGADDGGSYLLRRPQSSARQFGGELGGLLSVGGTTTRERDERQLASQHLAGGGAAAAWTPPATSSAGYEAFARDPSAVVEDGGGGGGDGFADGRSRARDGNDAREARGGGVVAPYHQTTADGWSAADSLRSSSAAVLTSTPLTSYVPPLNRDVGVGTTAAIMSPILDDAYADLSTLPYDPRLEIPVVWDVYMSDGGSTIESVLGNCLKLVQCAGRGAEILSRERELERGEWIDIGGSTVIRSRRTLMELVPMTSAPPPDDAAARASIADNTNGFITLMSASPDDAAARASIADNTDGFITLPSAQDAAPLPRVGDADPDIEIATAHSEIAPAFDPPLRTEVVYTSTYVNVDCTTPQGVDRGVYHHLAASGMSDVIHSSDIHDVARLFLPSSPTSVKTYGRAVVVLRNPIEMAVAKYERLKVVDGNVREMSLEEFAKSDYLEDNILTRTLAEMNNNHNYVLGANDLAKAKEILSRKFVVGIFESQESLEDSLERFETFFGWNLGSDSINNMHSTCRHEVVSGVMARHYNVNAGLPSNGSPAYMALEEKNVMDIELYNFARFLYDYQGRVLFGVTVSDDRLEHG